MEHGIERRQFLGAAALSAAAVVGVSLTGCSSSEPEAEKDSATTADQQSGAEVDALILGASTGGMLTAAYLAKAGKKVIVVEADNETGGTALISSGGILRSFPTWEEIIAHYPDLEGMTLPKAFVENFEPACQFIRDYVVPDATPISEMIPSLKDDIHSIYMGGTYAARREYFDDFDYFVTSNGGEILLNTSVVGLIMKDGTAVGATVVDEQGRRDILAKAVVISTGGFQANAEMMARYYGPYADNAVCRATPYNDGAGIRLAVEAGARLTKGFGSNYGHEVLADPIINYNAYANPLGAIEAYKTESKDDIRATFSTQNAFDGISIHLNLEGKRFFDEGYGAKLLTGVSSMSSYMNNAAILDQPFARAFSIFDSQAFDTEGGGYSAGVQTAVDNIEKFGGTIVKADTLEELFTALNEKLPLIHQIPVDTAVATINDFNAATEQGTAALEALNPPRTDTGMAALTVPPYYAVPVTAGISATQGGILINENCEVISDGSNLPIPGLFAIPLAAGGVYYHNYVSSALGVLTGFGYMAGKGVEAFLGE